MLEKWASLELAQSTSEGERCISMLQKALETLEIVRQDLVAGHAALLTNNVSLFEKKSLALDVSHEALSQIDVFNTLPDVNTFSFGFKKLEDEYFRLKAEESIDDLKI